MSEKEKSKSSSKSKSSHHAEKSSHKSSTTDKDKKSKSSSSKAKEEKPVEKKVESSGGDQNQIIAEKDALIKKLQAEKESQQKEIEEIKRQLAAARESAGIVVEEEDNSTEISYKSKKSKKVRINGEWKGVTAGGCMDNLTWRYNPQIFFWPSRSSTINFTLTQLGSGSPVGIGFYVFECPQETPRRILVDDKLQIGKSKFQATPSVEASFLIKKSKNPYVIIPTTMDTEIEMKFSMVLQCEEAPITAQLISKQQEWPLPTILGEWLGDTAGGCANNDTVVGNPQYLLKVTQQAKVRILLLQSKFGPDDNFDNIGFYLIQVENDRKQKIVDTGLFDNEEKALVVPEMNDSNEFTAVANLKPGSYAIIPCTFDVGQESSFQLMIMTDIELPPVVELIDAAVLSVNGSWEGEEAGGCLNDIRLWRANRQYALWVDKDADITLKIKQTSSVSSDLLSIGFYVFKGGKRVIKAKKERLLKKSKFGKKREGISEKLKLAASSEPYVIVPCTFEAFQEGTFSLSVLFADADQINDVRLEPLPEEWDFDYLCEHGEWTSSSAGGCLDFSTWRNNPQFLLEVSKGCELTVFLSCLTDKETTPGFYVVKAPNNMILNVNVKKEDILHKAQFTQAKEVSKSMTLTPGRYNIIPCTYTTGIECKFEISIFCNTYGACVFSPIQSGFLTIDGEWTKENSGGCINDMKSWLINPKFFLAVKQQTEIACILVQNPSEAIPEDLNSLLEIGMYITNSDGDGNAKTNESNDLISKADFSPDKDVVAVVDLPACHFPYVITPCTFKPGFYGKFRLYVLLDHANLEYIELSHNPININPSEVIGAGENPKMREIRRRFKPLASQTVELVKLTEYTEPQGEDGIPEFMNYIGRQLLGKVAEYQASIVAWGDGVEPQWWLDGYDEEPATSEPVVEEPVEEVVEVQVDEPMMKKSALKPPPKRQPALNFSKPVKQQMLNIDTTTQSGMTQEMIDELEAPRERLVVDSLLASIKGGLKALKKVEIPPKPIVTDPLACAFNMEVLNKRRAAFEGLNDVNDDADEWSVDDD